MSDEIFSTTLAYTKSPKATKRTSFQVKYGKAFGFDCAITEHLAVSHRVWHEAGGVLAQLLVCCRSPVNFGLQYYDTHLWDPVFNIGFQVESQRVTSELISL